MRNSEIRRSQNRTRRGGQRMEPHTLTTARERLSELHHQRRLAHRGARRDDHLVRRAGSSPSAGPGPRIRATRHLAAVLREVLEGLLHPDDQLLGAPPRILRSTPVADRETPRVPPRRARPRCPAPRDPEPTTRSRWPPRAAGAVSPRLPPRCRRPPPRFTVFFLGIIYLTTTGSGGRGSCQTVSSKRSHRI